MSNTKSNKELTIKNVVSIFKKLGFNEFYGDSNDFELSRGFGGLSILGGLSGQFETDTWGNNSTGRFTYNVLGEDGKSILLQDSDIDKVVSFVKQIGIKK